MSQLTSPKPTSSLSIVVPEEARSTLLYMAVEGFTSPEWRRLLQHLENLASFAVPLPFAPFPIQVTIRWWLKRVSITTDIPARQEDHQICGGEARLALGV